MLRNNNQSELTLVSKSLTWIQGEVGQSKLNSFGSKPDDAMKDFEKKFKDKTKNNWSDRSNFVSHAGKYTLIEVDGEEDAEVKVTQMLIENRDALSCETC